MRTIETTVYTFDELSEQAQQTALGHLWDINVHDLHWWEDIAEDITAFGKASGLGCVYGGEFDCERGRYLHITDVSCTLSDFMAQRTAGRHSDFPNIEADVIDPFINAFTHRQWLNLLRLERAGILGTLSGETSTDRHGIRSDVERFDGYGHQTPRITRLLDSLEEAWRDLVRDLEQCYLSMLDAEYDYQASEETVRDTIIANGYEFTVDGAII